MYASLFLDAHVRFCEWMGAWLCFWSDACERGHMSIRVCVQCDRLMFLEVSGIIEIIICKWWKSVTMPVLEIMIWFSRSD